MSSTRTLSLLRDYESRNVTFIETDGSWPIVWERARGVHVWDAEGKKYLDLTAAFGVAAAGHANPRVVRAAQRQMTRLVHAMGDVHPHALKAKLARELSAITFERWTGNQSKVGTKSKGSQRGKTIFCNSGFEAVEAALKTSMLATGKPSVVAFKGGYHGLGYGALNATHREHFRSPFRSQLREFAVFVDFPGTGSESSSDDHLGLRTLNKLEGELSDLLSSGEIGAVLVEPIQGRGGINIPPETFLPLLRRLCDEHEALLILDEIYTGFGRTGKWFACEHSETVPDLICLGKALTGGFPLSACVGRADWMDKAWPPSTGEAIHTSTYLGHPVGCAMALAQIQEIRRLKLVERSAKLGQSFLTGLRSVRSKQSPLKLSARGRGLLAGLEMRTQDGRPATETSFRVIKEMLRRGFILLPEGEHANIISFSPPLTISERQLFAALKALEEAICQK